MRSSSSCVAAPSWSNTAQLQRVGEQMRIVFARVVFGVFVVLGVLMAVFGRGSDRIVGVSTVLFFGVGGLGLLFSPRLTRPGPPELKPIVYDGEHGRLASVSRGKIRLSALSMMGMAA